MRALLWALILGSIVGGLLLWFVDPADSGGADNGEADDEVAGVLRDEGGTDHSTRDEGGRPMRAQGVQDVIVIERPGAWPAGLLRESVVFGDPRIDQVEFVSPTGENYSLTGAGLLAILEREFRGTALQFRFEDEGVLEGFKKCVFKEPIPPRAPLRSLLDQSMFSGFAFVSYRGKAYVTPLVPGELPGGEVPPAVPDDGVEPEIRRPK